MNWCERCENKSHFCGECITAIVDGKETTPSHFAGKTIPIKNLNHEQEDIVNHPTHYHQNGIDVIGFSELQFSKEELKGFYRINVLKYVTRYDRKGGAEDLKKAEFYLNKLKEL